MVQRDEPDKRDEALQTKEEATATSEAGAAPTAEARLAELQEQLAAKTREAEELLERLRRVQADFQNYKKRKEREQEELLLLLEDRILSEILPLYDDLERAFAALKGQDEREAFIEGMERIFAKFKDFLVKKQIQPIQAVGRKFDPSRHEVLLAVEHEGEPHVVLEEFERGYLRGERLLRPSRVKVGRPKSRPATEAASGADHPSDNQQGEKES